MDRIRYERNYDLHSWTGIALGLIVYTVALTGCFALFANEIKSWEDPTLRVSLNDAWPPMDSVYQDWVQAQAGDGRREFMRFDYPTRYAPYFLGMVEYHAENDQHIFVQQRWNANTGEPIAERGTGLSQWLLDFHRHFMWPERLGGAQVGRSLVGVGGVVLLLSIISGIVAHPKLRKEAFSMRLHRSQRLKWQDPHKVIGLWGLPFYIMIAFTGAFLGVVVIVSQLTAAIAFKGDLDALVGAVLGTERTPIGEQAAMLSLDEISAMRHPETGEPPLRVIMENYGDAAAEFDIHYAADTELAAVQIVSVNGATGATIEGDPFRELTAANRVTNAMSPLHYGTYGGIWLKLLYFILGLSLAVITALGLVMWIERRKHGHEGSKSEAFYSRLSHFNTGVVLGLPVATLAIFYLDKLYVGDEASRLAATGWTYFGVWALGPLHAFQRNNGYATTRELLTLTGLLAMGIAALNGVATGDWFMPQLGSMHSVAAWVDALMLVGGLLAIAVGQYFPARRQTAPRESHQLGHLVGRLNTASSAPTPRSFVNGETHS